MLCNPGHNIAGLPNYYYYRDFPQYQQGMRIFFTFLTYFSILKF